LEASRLVSIVGPGGIGKTTVALAVAEQLTLATTARRGVWCESRDCARSGGVLQRTIDSGVGAEATSDVHGDADALHAQPRPFTRIDRGVVEIRPDRVRDEIAGVAERELADDAKGGIHRRLGSVPRSCRHLVALTACMGVAIHSSVDLADWARHPSAAP
jgi:hypothetical protein